MINKYGFIHEAGEIMVLILFVIRRLPQAVTLSELTELAMCDDGISYFDVTDCINKLVNTGHLKHEDEKFSLTLKGERNGEILEKELPCSVKEKAEAAASLVRAAQVRNSMIKTNHEILEDGACSVILSLSDGISEIISINLIAANEKQAGDIKRGFRKNAEKIYKTIIEMATKS